jgi:selenocysteine lyase/cysteine desulfurase
MSREDSLQPDPEAFALPRKVTYLDTARCALPLRSIAQESLRAIEHWHEQGEETAEAVRSLFAELIGARADDIALISATTRGIATICHLIPLAAGQQVVLMADEHPSQVLGWLEACRASGAQPVFVPKPPDGNWTEALIAALSEATAVVCFAPCHWCDGTFLDAAAIAARARQVGARIVIDGTQAIGAMPFDVAGIAPDFVVTSGYKWLLGPVGLGYLYAHPRYHDADPTDHGWNNRIPAVGATLWDGARLVYPQGYVRGARRFDTAGSGESLLPGLALVGLRQLLTWKPERIHELLRGWNTALAADIDARQVRRADPSHGHTHILGLDLGREASSTLAGELRALGIEVSVRGPTLRISPHLWTTPSDIDRLRGVLLARLQRASAQE